MVGSGRRSLLSCGASFFGFNRLQIYECMNSAKKQPKFLFKCNTDILLCNNFSSELLLLFWEP